MNDLAYKIGMGALGVFTLATSYLAVKQGNEIFFSSPPSLESRVQGTQTNLSDTLRSYVGLEPGVYDKGLKLSEEPKSEKGLPSHGILHNKLQQGFDGEIYGIVIAPEAQIYGYSVFNNGGSISDEVLSGQHEIQAKLDSQGPGTYQMIASTSKGVVVSPELKIMPSPGLAAPQGTIKYQ